MDILDEIKEFCAQTGMAPSTLGQYALKNPRIVERLEARRDLTQTTETKLRAFMEAERKKRGDAT